MNINFVSLCSPTSRPISILAAYKVPIHFFVVRVTTFFERNPGPHFGDTNRRSGGTWGGACLLVENSSHFFFQTRARKCIG
jgi:hypothetical protein